MNVKEHIEAGHYPRDDKGRALVPIAREVNETFVVLLTDLPGELPIGGFRKSNGLLSSHRVDTDFLLPPPPRKVKVTAYAQIASNGDIRRFARSDVSLHLHGCAPGMDEDRVVELTGEYDQGWE